VPDEDFTIYAEVKDSVLEVGYKWPEQGDKKKMCFKKNLG